MKLPMVGNTDRIATSVTMCGLVESEEEKGRVKIGGNCKVMNVSQVRRTYLT